MFQDISLLNRLKKRQEKFCTEGDGSDNCNSIIEAVDRTEPESSGFCDIEKETDKQVGVQNERWFDRARMFRVRQQNEEKSPSRKNSMSRYRSFRSIGRGKGPEGSQGDLKSSEEYPGRLELKGKFAWLDKWYADMGHGIE
jgi:hypothetical protein